MAEDVTIRRVERDDEQALLQLWKDFLEEQSALDERFRVAEDAADRWENDFHLQRKQERRRLYVAEQGGEVVGFIDAVRWAPPPVYTLTSEVYIEEMYVRPEARGRNVGVRLLDAVRCWAGEVGADRLRLGALVGNEEGRAFWERHGARPFSTTYTIELEGSKIENRDEQKAKLGF